MEIIPDLQEFAIQRARGKFVVYAGASNEHSGLSAGFSEASRVARRIVGLDVDPSVAAAFPSVVHVDLNEPFLLDFREAELVIMTEVLEHLISPVLTLRQIRRNFPKAEILFSVPNGLSLGRVILALLRPRLYAQQDGLHTALFNENTLRRVLQLADLKDCSILAYDNHSLTRVLVTRIRPSFASGYLVMCR